MKKFLIMVFITTFIYASSVTSYINDLKKLTPSQKKIMEMVWNKSKPYDLAYTMTAIAYRESHFGEYMINLSDPSCGIFHKLLPTYAVEVGLRPNKWNQSRLCDKLISDFEESFMVALNDLSRAYNYWRIKGYSHSVAWKRMVISYNGGLGGINNKRAISYYEEIVKIIKAIKFLKRKGFFSNLK